MSTIKESYKGRGGGSRHRAIRADLHSNLGSYLDPSRNVINDANGFRVWVTGQAVGDDVILHLPRRLSARFLPIDGFTCRTLKTAVLDQRKCQNQPSSRQSFIASDHSRWKDDFHFTFTLQQRLKLRQCKTKRTKLIWWRSEYCWHTQSLNLLVCL